jgi:succinate-acetate transporter protein
MIWPAVVLGVCAFSSYGGFWISLGVYEILAYAGVAERDAGAVQMMLCTWGVLTAALLVQTLRVWFHSYHYLCLIMIPKMRYQSATHYSLVN